MWSWECEATRETSATPEAIWKMWSDVSQWAMWDEALAWCKLDGPFIVGAEGKLKPKAGAAVAFRLTQVEEKRAFADIALLPLTKLEFFHRLDPLPNGKWRLTHRASAKGLLAPLLWLTLRRALKKDLPKAMEKLSQLAEKL